MNGCESLGLCCVRSVRKGKTFRPDAETGRQFRSRLIEILNVPQRVRLRFRLACGLADGLFEHPATFRCAEVIVLGLLET